jgi:hypothetical protein
MLLQDLLRMVVEDMSSAGDVFGLPSLGGVEIEVAPCRFLPSRNRCYLRVGGRLVFDDYLPPDVHRGGCEAPELFLDVGERPLGVKTAGPTAAAAVRHTAAAAVTRLLVDGALECEVWDVAVERHCSTLWQAIVLHKTSAEEGGEKGAEAEAAAAAAPLPALEVRSPRGMFRHVADIVAVGGPGWTALPYGAEASALEELSFWGVCLHSRLHVVSVRHLQMELGMLHRRLDAATGVAHDWGWYARTFRAPAVLAHPHDPDAQLREVAALRASGPSAAGVRPLM